MNNLMDKILRYSPMITMPPRGGPVEIWLGALFTCHRFICGEHYENHSKERHRRGGGVALRNLGSYQPDPNAQDILLKNIEVVSE